MDKIQASNMTSKTQPSGAVVYFYFVIDLFACSCMYECTYVCVCVSLNVYVEARHLCRVSSSVSLHFIFRDRISQPGLVSSSMPPDETDNVLLFLFVKFPLNVRKGNDFPKSIGLFASHTHLCSLAVGHLSTKEGEKCHLAPFCLCSFEGWNI